MGWFRQLQSAGDTEKGVPDNNSVLVYNSTTMLWELKDRSTFDSTDAVYLGDPTVNGTWRIVRDGNNLSFQRLETGVWTEKGANTP